MIAPDKMTIEQLEPYAKEWMRRIRSGKTPRAQVLRPCPKCNIKMGARELRAHKPLCKSTKKMLD